VAASMTIFRKGGSYRTCYFRDSWSVYSLERLS